MKLEFRTIDHNSVDQTWANVQALADHPLPGMRSVVARQLVNGEFSVRILGNGRERYRVRWEGKFKTIAELEAAIDEFCTVKA